MIVRWSLDELCGTLAELGLARPFMIASSRWQGLALDPPPHARWAEIPTERINEVVAAAGGSDVLLPVGGGSAIDLAKAVSAETGLPVVSVPTTYAGAEWTTFFGVRDQGRRLRGGGSGARLAAVVYEPGLTLGLAPAETVGTALNALAHAAEALYVARRNPEGDREALAGATLIGEWLPAVVERPDDLVARTELLRGAMHAGAALGSAGLGVGHALAQALGGRYGLPHGALNAICLPPALRFNESVARAAIGRFAAALRTDDAPLRVEELARLGGFGRLRELGVPAEDLDQVAEVVASRPGARANPRPVTAADAAALLRSVW